MPALADRGIALALSAIIAGLLAVAAGRATRRTTPVAAFLALALAPSLVIYAANPLHRVYSFHGFAHIAIADRILLGSLPPDNPYFAGAPLLYPWAYHLVAAALVASLGISVPTAFAVTNVVALAVAMFALYEAGREAFDHPAAIRWGVLAGLFGFATASAYYVVRIALARGIPLDFRGLPPVTYFTIINATSVGLACYAVAILATLRLATLRGSSWCTFALATALVGCGLFYPFHFIVAALCAATSAACLALLGDSRRRGSAAHIIAAILVAGAILSPYLLGLVMPKAPAARERVVLGAGNLVRLALFLLPVAMLLAVERRALLELARERRVGLGVLAVFAVVPAALYAVILAPGTTEYKFLTLSSIGFGLLAGPCLASLFGRRPGAGCAVAALFFLPVGADVVYKGLSPWQVTDPFVEDGAILRHGDAGEEALYAWMRDRTPPDAVFIDDRRTVPIFGRRSLYTIVDEPAERRRTGFNGWRVKARQALEDIHGYPAAEVRARNRLVEELTKGGERVDDERLRGAADVVAGRPLFVVARLPSARERLASDPRFLRVFEGSAAVVYRLQSGNAANDP